MASPYRINLPVYEGPLDLLLDLIRKQEMDIHNIPIAKITEQYLDYLHQLEKLDIDVSADFIYMAATLIHIKSKMLLPADPLLAGSGAVHDPRDDLVHRLLEHEKFKNAAQLLYQKQQVEDHVWSQSGSKRCTAATKSRANWSCRSWIWSRRSSRCSSGARKSRNSSCATKPSPSRR